jgi:sugar/nucleoside kinase (ribokinase family)
VLPFVDHILPNAVVACAIAGEADVERAALRLAAQGATALVKCGTDGVLAAAGGAVRRTPALAVEVVDTIGAGDSTNAGWLAGVLRGWPPGRALRLAAACGSLSTRARGGTHGQPTLDEALAAL